jgi:hypothetical protein
VIGSGAAAGITVVEDDDTEPGGQDSSCPFVRTVPDRGTCVMFADIGSSLEATVALTMTPLVADAIALGDGDTRSH